MALLEFLTADLIIDDWLGCADWCKDPVKKARLIELAGTPPGMPVVTSLTLAPGGSDPRERCWMFNRPEVLGPKVWELNADILDPAKPGGVEGITHVDSLAVLTVLRQAETGAFPDFNAVNEIRVNSRRAQPAIPAVLPDGVSIDDFLRGSVQSYYPVQVSMALQEQVMEGRSTKQRTYRTSAALMRALNALAESFPVGPAQDAVYQGVLDKILGYYVDAGLA